MEEDAPHQSLSPTARRDLRETAAHLVEELEKVSIGELTPRQYALFCDAEGLLQGIADGRITSTQPRIRDELVEVVSLFGKRFDRWHSGKKQHPEAHESIKALLTVIGGAAVNGLTLEGVDLSLGRESRGRGRS